MDKSAVVKSAAALLTTSLVLSLISPGSLLSRNCCPVVVAPPFCDASITIVCVRCSTGFGAILTSLFLATLAAFAISCEAMVCRAVGDNASLSFILVMACGRRVGMLASVVWLINWLGLSNPPAKKHTRLLQYYVNTN